MMPGPGSTGSSMEEKKLPLHLQNMIHAAQLAIERKVFKVEEEQKKSAAIRAARARVKADSISKAKQIQKNIVLLEKKIQMEKKRATKIQSFAQIQAQQEKAVADLQAKSEALQAAEKEKH